MLSVYIILLNGLHCSCPNERPMFPFYVIVVRNSWNLHNFLFCISQHLRILIRFVVTMAFILLLGMCWQIIFVVLISVLRILNVIGKFNII